MSILRGDVEISSSLYVLKVSLSSDPLDIPLDKFNFSTYNDFEISTSPRSIYIYIYIHDTL